MCTTLLAMCTTLLAMYTTLLAAMCINVVAHLLCMLPVQVTQLGYEVLLVSQFTLYGRVRKKPDFSKAMPPQQVGGAGPAAGCLGHVTVMKQRQLVLNILTRSWAVAVTLVTYTIDYLCTELPACNWCS
jgi:hypothetical protein